MNAARYARVRELFHAASELDPGDRPAFLDQACDGDVEIREEVESLLTHAEGSSALLSDQNAGLGHKLVAEWTAAVPERIGRYRIIRRIGEGGMGTVYEARQDNPARTVALKVIRPGLASPQLLRRFQREAEMLGRLRHPGIAHVYEAGIAETPFGPQPYFAMEYIDGRPIHTYVDARRLDTRARLRLVADVCSAVQHAHERGVIHRDLKPANILVDDSARPKILDFGVARATNADVRAVTLQTEVGQVLGTLPYMSPEQLDGNTTGVDHRSDIYALGVISFELLSGRLPQDVSNRALAEAARIIREEDCPKLGEFDPAFRGDVETIVARALEKEPQRRYPSAAALAEDIDRYLRDLPIVARPTSAVYQLRKFARRNRGLVAGLAAAFLALVLGMAGTTWFAFRASAQRSAAEAARDLARLEAARAQAINQFLVKDLLGSGDPRAGATPDLTLAEVVSRAAARVTDSFADQPEVRAAVHKTLGDVFYGIGRYDDAAEQLAAAVDIYDKTPGAHSPDHYAALYALAHAHWRAARLDQAESILRQVTEHYRTLQPPDPEKLGEAVNALANVLYWRGQYAEAGPVYEEALELLQLAHPGDSEDVAAVLGNLANVAYSTNRRQEAVERQRQSLAMWRRVLGEEHVQTSMGINNLAIFLAATGQPEEAEPLFHEALRIRRKFYGDEHPDIAGTLGRLGQLYGGLDQFEKARRHFEEALAMTRKLYGERHIDVGQLQGNYAAMLMEQGELAAAEAARREQLEIYTQAYGENNRRTIQAAGSLAWLLNQQGRHDESLRICDDLLPRCPEAFPPEHYFPDFLAAVRAVSLAHGDDPASAEAMLRAAHDRLASRLGENDRLVRATGDMLREVEVRSGKRASPSADPTP